MTAQQTRRAALFHSLHTAGDPVVLVNAWDAASARIIEAAGARAIATTSAGVAWSLGAPDGDVLDRDQAIRLVTRIVAAVSAPVTADIESGFGATPDEVADTVSAVIAAGAIGVNIEDTVHGRGGRALRGVTDQCARLSAARAAADAVGIPLFLNARIDTFLWQLGGLPETLERARAYLAAGANGIFVPGVTNPDAVAKLVAKIGAPVNMLAGPGSPSVSELAALGVARVSLGSSVAQAAYAVAHRAAEEVLKAGTYGVLTDALDFRVIDALMTNSEQP